MNKPKIATRDEALEILTDLARNGSITAAAALARELRARERDEHETVEDEFDALIARK